MLVVLSRGVYLPFVCTTFVCECYLRLVYVCAPCWLGRSGQYLLGPTAWWH